MALLSVVIYVLYIQYLLALSQTLKINNCERFDIPNQFVVYQNCTVVTFHYHVFYFCHLPRVFETFLLLCRTFYVSYFKHIDLLITTNTHFSLSLVSSVCTLPSRTPGFFEKTLITCSWPSAIQLGSMACILVHYCFAVQFGACPICPELSALQS